MAPGGDQAKFSCVQGYKNSLKSQIVKVHGIYDGYLQNFSTKDGSLIQLNKELSEEVKKMQKSVVEKDIIWSLYLMKLNSDLNYRLNH